MYVERPDGAIRFRWVKAPSTAELTQLTHTIARRVGRFLERQGLLERDVEHNYLAGKAIDAGPMDQLLGHSITYRIAVGPQAGRKVFTLQTLPADDDPLRKASGFSLHAGVAARADERDKLERLCRYITRPAVSEKRLSLTGNGNVRYDVNGITNVAGAGMRRSDQLKTPYRDGTTHVTFESFDFIARLAALIPKPRVNPTRFHGVFAPNSRQRAFVTPAKRGKGNHGSAPDVAQEQTPPEPHAAMTWAQRLKRVFKIEICRHCRRTVLRIYRESRRSNPSFHVYPRSAGGRQTTDDCRPTAPQGTHQLTSAYEKNLLLVSRSTRQFR